MWMRKKNSFLAINLALPNSSAFSDQTSQAKTCKCTQESNTLDGPLQPCTYVNCTKMWNLLNHFQDVSNAA